MVTERDIDSAIVIDAFWEVLLDSDRGGLTEKLELKLLVSDRVFSSDEVGETVLVCDAELLVEMERVPAAEELSEFIIVPD